MYTNTNSSHKIQQRGVTLIELIVFIMIVSVAVVGVLKVLEVTNKNSVSPIIFKQAMSIAESLLIEIEQQPFTLCDPNDSNASEANDATDCTAGFSQDNSGGTLGPIPNTESRYNDADLFDHVSDYNGFTMPDANCAGICNPGGAGTGTVIDATLQGYSATVTVTRIGTALGTGLDNDAALRIDVTVTGPAKTTVKLTGYKVRYAPKA
jgi:MSHA pilin protein MshD